MAKQTQSGALQLMVSGFCLPFSTSLLLNSQLRVTTHPSPSSGKRGVAAPHYPGGSCHAGVSTAGKQRSGEEPWTRPHLESKGQN